MFSPSKETTTFSLFLAITLEFSQVSKKSFELFILTHSAPHTQTRAEHSLIYPFHIFLEQLLSGLEKS